MARTMSFEEITKTPEYAKWVQELKPQERKLEDATHARIEARLQKMEAKQDRERRQFRAWGTAQREALRMKKRRLEAAGYDALLKKLGQA